MDIGKFQGVIAATTPTGCFSTSMRLLRSTVSSTSPVTRRHSDANQSTLPALQLQQQRSSSNLVHVPTAHDWYCIMLQLLLLVPPPVMTAALPAVPSNGEAPKHPSPDVGSACASYCSFDTLQVLSVRPSTPPLTLMLFLPVTLPVACHTPWS